MSRNPFFFCDLTVTKNDGVAAPVAQILARRHSAGRIRTAVTYAQGYHGELLNKPGYVVSALQDGWKVPKWCYRPELAKNGPKQPSEAQSLPDPTSDIPPDWEDRRRKSLHAELWNQVCSIIQGNIQPQSFATWFQPCYISRVSEGTVTLAAPNRFFAEWLGEHYLWLIRRTLDEVDESIQRVNIEDPTAPTSGYR